jgi:hypothetical protein
MNNIKKVIIWGHKLHSHTHSYIHNGFYIGFKYLGYDTYWYDNTDNITGVDFSDSLFLTEGQVDSKIPLRNDCYYILHNVDERRYQESVVDRNKVLIIQVYTKDCTKRGDPEIKPFFHYSKSKNHTTYNVLYFPWATDLLPHEIETNIQHIDTITTEERVCYIGFGTSSLKPVENFCSNNGLEFMLCGGFSNNVDTETNQAYISQSLLAPAIQSDWQVQNGYIPCRIFKNISYGKMGLTNSETVYRLFERKIIYHSDTSTCMELGLNFERNDVDKTQKVIDLMNIVKEHHTYVNRIKMILNYLL